MDCTRRVRGASGRHRGETKKPAILTTPFELRVPQVGRDVKLQWGVMNEDRNEALVNTFDPRQVGTCYLCSADAGTVNLELMSRDVTLAPGASITLEHSYWLMNDLKELAE